MQKISHSYVKIFVTVIGLFFMNEVALAIPTKVYWTVIPDSVASPKKTPFIKIHQRLPVGDRMAATLTWGKNHPIINADGSMPMFGGTVAPATDGISFDMPSVINGKVVTDIHQTHSDPSVPDGTLELAAFQNINGTLQPAGLSTWLLQNAPVISIPDFFSATTNLFYGVDLTIWNQQGFNVNDSSLGQTFNITNGLSSSLPGFIFSSNPLSMDTSGWASDAVYSGTVTLDSYHTLSVPEPKSLILLGMGIFMLTSTRRRKRSLPQ